MRDRREERLEVPTQFLCGSHHPTEETTRRWADIGQQCEPTDFCGREPDTLQAHVGAPCPQLLSCPSTLRGRKGAPHALVPTHTQALLEEGRPPVP